MTAAEFTKEELYKIAEWAMDAATAARRGKYINVYAYELAKSISDKVFAEYCKKEKEG